MFGDCGILPLSSFSFDGVSSSTFWLVVAFLFIGILVVFDLFTKTKQEFITRNSLLKNTLNSALLRITELEKNVSELIKVPELTKVPELIKVPELTKVPEIIPSPKIEEDSQIDSEAETDSDSDTDSQNE